MISYGDFTHPSRVRVQVNISSPAGSYASSSTPFFHYVVRLSEAGLRISDMERNALELLGAIPHAFFDDDFCEGPGWRVVPPRSYADWPVLETEPYQLRAALETASGLIWLHAAAMGISVREIALVEEEIAKVLFVTDLAEQGGYKMNMTYVS